MHAAEVTKMLNNKGKMSDIFVFIDMLLERCHLARDLKIIVEGVKMQNRLTVYYNATLKKKNYYLSDATSPGILKQSWRVRRLRIGLCWVGGRTCPNVIYISSRLVFYVFCICLYVRDDCCLKQRYHTHDLQIIVDGVKMQKGLS